MTTWQIKTTWPNVGDDPMAGDPAGTRDWHDDTLNAGQRALLNAVIEAVRKNPDLAATLGTALKIASEAKR
jgi:hypothetical protein